MKPRPKSVINYSELRAQKARLGLYNEDLVKTTGMGCATISGILNGAETSNLQKIIKLAAALDMDVRVDFVCRQSAAEVPTEQNSNVLPMRNVA